MISQIASIAKTLKDARERQGLSQRALAAKVGVPQSHISKIENAAVDLQTTSLIAIARALDLEVALVPRQALPVLQTMLQKSEGTAVLPETARRLREMRAPLQRLATRFGLSKALHDMLFAIDRIGRLPRTAQSAEQIMAFAKLNRRRIEAIEHQSFERGAIAPGALADLVRIRDELVKLHDDLAAASPLHSLAQRPAYSLDDDNG